MPRKTARKLTKTPVKHTGRKGGVGVLTPETVGAMAGAAIGGLAGMMLGNSSKNKSKISLAKEGAIRATKGAVNVLQSQTSDLKAETQTSGSKKSSEKQSKSK